MSITPSSDASSTESDDWTRDTIPWDRQPLPESRNCDGRPLWEPPILCYDGLIGEDYEQKRKALLEHNKGNRGITTKILDIHAEYALLMDYGGWIFENKWEARIVDDSKREGFFGALDAEVVQDYSELYREYVHLGVHTRKKDDGSYEVEIFDPKSFAKKFDQTPNHFAERSKDSVAEAGNASLFADSEALSPAVQSGTSTQASIANIHRLSFSITAMKPSAEAQDYWLLPSDTPRKQSFASLALSLVALRIRAAQQDEGSGGDIHDGSDID